jgi:cysteine desulfurase
MTATKHQDGKWVYLDNNATTRPDPRVLEAMFLYLSERFANPSSVHSKGYEAAAAITAARQQVQVLLNAERERNIIFTSGGSESNNAAILSALETQSDRNEIVTSTVEHPSVLALCAHLERIGRAKIHRISVDGDGILDMESYQRALNNRTAVVSIQWANNETGVIQPIQLLASLAHQSGALFHSDAVQATGRVAIDVRATEIDMLSVSAHKLHGPKGVGALYIRKGLRLEPMIRGGHQEYGRRAGTENVAGIVGFGMAAEICCLSLALDMPHIAAMRDRLEHELLRNLASAVVVGHREKRLPNTLCIAFANMESDAILTLLDHNRVAASSGSACAAGSMEPSHVLRAMRIPFSYLRGAIRFSFSRENTMDDVDYVVSILPGIVNQLRASCILEEVAHD